MAVEGRPIGANRRQIVGQRQVTAGWPTAVVLVLDSTITGCHTRCTHAHKQRQDCNPPALGTALHFAAALHNPEECAMRSVPNFADPCGAAPPAWKAAPILRCRYHGHWQGRAGARPRPCVESQTPGVVGHVEQPDWMLRPPHPALPVRAAWGARWWGARADDSG